MSGFHALSEPIRIQILELLQTGEYCVQDISAALQLSQSNISFHLKTLRASGLVAVRKQGRWTYYSLNASQFEVLGAYLAEY